MAERRFTSTGLEYVLTVPHDDHRPFILSCIGRQVVTVPGVRELPRPDRSRVVSLAEDRWDDPAFDVLVAVSPDDPWLVMGFAMGRGSDLSDEDPILTYLHVRGGFRGMGLARELAALLGIRPGRPTVVELPTWDLVRENPGHEYPIGLLRNPNWRLSLVDPRRHIERERLTRRD